MKPVLFIPRNSLRPQEVGEQLFAVIQSFLENSSAVFGGPDGMLPWQEVCVVPYVRKRDDDGQFSDPPAYLLQGIYFASTKRREDDEIQADIMDLLRSDSPDSTISVHAPGSKFDVKMSIDTEKEGRIYVFFNHITLSIEDDAEQKGLRSLGSYTAVEDIMNSLLKAIRDIINTHGLG